MTPAEAYERAHELLRQYGPDAPFILNFGFTPTGNMHALEWWPGEEPVEMLFHNPEEFRRASERRHERQS